MGRRRRDLDAYGTRRSRQRGPQSAARAATAPAYFCEATRARLVEQRRILALDAESNRWCLLRSIRCLLRRNDLRLESGVYLGLRSIYHDLEHAKSDDALREVVARLWDMAIATRRRKSSPQAEQALRQAQEALRQALERGARRQKSRAHGTAARGHGQIPAGARRRDAQEPATAFRPLDRNTRTLSQQDLKSMLDRLENLARSGNKDAARRLLEELQSMLENLQMARPGASGGDDGDDDMMSALDELGDVILHSNNNCVTKPIARVRTRDATASGDSSPARAIGRWGDLRQDQQGLRDRLNKLLDQLRQRGLGQPGQQGEGNEMGQLGDAGKPWVRLKAS